MTMQYVPGRRGLIAVRADASNVQALIGDLNKTVADFRAEIDGQLKAKADVVVAEKVDRMNDHISNVQAAIDELNAKIAAAQMGVGTKQKGDPKYTDAFQAFVRKGAESEYLVNASLNKGTAGEGGYLTPTEWDRTLTDRLVILSPFRRLARVQQIGGADFSKLFNARGMGSGWVGETAARPETTTPTLGTLTYATGEIYANPSATQRLLDDAALDIEQFIADEVETEFAYQENIAFIAGNGTNKPNGVLTYVTGAANAASHPWGAIQVTTAAGAAAITVDELLTLVGALPSAYSQNAAFMLNRATVYALRKLKDSAGQYLWQPSMQAGQPQTLLGFPVEEMAAMPTMAANAISVLFGDFQRGYLVVDRMGIRVLRDPYTNKPYVMFYTTRRVGGGLLDPDAFKALKQAAS